MSLGGAVMRNVTRNSGEPKTIKMFFNIFWPIKKIFIAILRQLHGWPKSFCFSNTWNSLGKLVSKAKSTIEIIYFSFENNNYLFVNRKNMCYMLL